jgi:hypothetical protein
MTRSRRHGRALFAATLCALAALLLLATTAMADMQTVHLRGEASVAADPGIAAEADIVGIFAEEESIPINNGLTWTHAMTVKVTTAAAPAGGASTAGLVTYAAGDANAYQLSVGHGRYADECEPGDPPNAGFGQPSLVFDSTYGSTYVGGEVRPEGAGPFYAIPGGTKSVSGATTTLSASVTTEPEGYLCVVAVVDGPDGEVDHLDVPLEGFVIPPPTSPSSTAAVTAPPPAATPAPTLSVEPAETTSLEAGRWGTARFKVANTGSAAVGPVALKLASPAAVVVHRRSRELPTLAAGQSRTISFKVKLKPGAKTRSKLRLTASVAGTSFQGATVLRRLEERRALKNG